MIHHDKSTNILKKNINAVVSIRLFGSDIVYVTDINTNLAYKMSIMNEAFKSIRQAACYRKKMNGSTIKLPQTLYQTDSKIFFDVTVEDLKDIYESNDFKVTTSPKDFIVSVEKEKYYKDKKTDDLKVSANKETEQVSNDNEFEQFLKEDILEKYQKYISIFGKNKALDLMVEMLAQFKD